MIFCAFGCWSSLAIEAAQVWRTGCSGSQSCGPATASRWRPTAVVWGLRVTGIEPAAISEPSGAFTTLESRTVTVRPPPAPQITGLAAAPTAGTLGLPTTFTAGLGGGPVASYSWDFGNGAGSPAASPTYTYPAPGTYTVSLTVTGPFGATDTHKDIG